MKMQKGEKMRIALELIDEGIGRISDLMTVLTSAETSYGHSMIKGLRMMDKLDRERERNRLMGLERARLRALVAKLKKEKLVTASPTGWRITNAGREKMQKLADRLLRKKSYPEEKAPALTIVMFDVPEKYKGYRDWMRAAIRGCGFDQLQKSVFAGNVRLPEEFINDLDRLSLLRYVEIFSVSEKGTLEKIPYA
ncbi:MAG: hypothetical protein Q7R63_01110 [bacterium]|nr:hypothetical protein [bacterium]